MARRRPGRVRDPAKPAAEAACELDAQGCEVSELFRLFGKAHVLDILALFCAEDAAPRRFVDIQRRLDLSPNTLSERLKELVEAGLLSRTVYNEIPPRVDYQATAKAKDLGPVFEALHDWSERHDLRPVSSPTEPAKA